MKEEPIFTLKTTKASSDFVGNLLPNLLLGLVTLLLLLLLPVSGFNFLIIAFVFLWIIVLLVYYRFGGFKQVFMISDGFIYKSHFVFPVCSHDGIYTVPPLQKTFSKINKYESIEYIEAYRVDIGEKQYLQLFNNTPKFAEDAIYTKNIMKFVPTADFVAVKTFNNAFKAENSIVRDPKFQTFINYLIQGAKGKDLTRSIKRETISREYERPYVGYLMKPEDRIITSYDNLSEGVWINNDMETNEGGKIGFIFMVFLWMALWTPAIIVPIIIGDLENFLKWFGLTFFLFVLFGYFIPFTYLISVRRGRWFLSGIGHKKLDRKLIRKNIERILQEQRIGYTKLVGVLLDERNYLYKFKKKNYSLQIHIPWSNTTRLMDVSVGPIRKDNEKEIIELLKVISKWSRNELQQRYGKSGTRYAVQDPKNLLKLKNF